MRTKTAEFAAYAILLLMVAGSVSAEERYFLSIGVNDYDSREVPPQRFAVSNAKDIADVFERAGYRGTILTDGAATRSRILDEILRLRKTASDSDVFVLYITGVGRKDDALGQSYFLPHDTDLERLQINALRTEHIVEYAMSIPARRKLLILDYPYASDDWSSLSRQSKKQISSGKFDKIVQDDGTVIISTPDLTHEIPDLLGSVLASAVVDVMVSRSGDFNADGVLDIGEFTTYVKGAVEKSGAKFGIYDQISVFTDTRGQWQLLGYAAELPRLDDKVIAQQLRDVHKKTLEAWETRGWISLTTKIFAQLILDRWAGYGESLSEEEKFLVESIRLNLESDGSERVRAAGLEMALNERVSNSLPEVEVAPDIQVEIFRNTSKAAQQPRVRVRVPDGYKIVGGGASVDYGKGAGNMLTESYPYDERSWVVASKDHERASLATITAYALAIYDPADAYDVRIFSAKSGTAAVDPSVSASVPSGYVMTGGGARVEWRGDGSGNLLWASFPENDSAWAAKSKSHQSASPAHITAYAIGLRPNNKSPLPEVVIEKSTSSVAKKPIKRVRVADGYVLTGGGAITNWKRAGSLLTASFPSSPSLWAASSKDHVISDPTSITVYAIALKASAQ